MQLTTTFTILIDMVKGSDEDLSGKLYCVMSNQQAMLQLLSLWNHFQNGEENVFQHGFAGIRDVFTHIKNIRKWGAHDRIAENACS